LAEVALPLPMVRRTAMTARLGALVPVACALAAAALWVVTVHRANFAAMGRLGLVSILGPAYFLGLALLCVGLAVELVRTHPHQGRLLGLVVVLIVYLFGSACAIEPVAALTSSWGHAGFVRYVFVNGHPRNGYSAEFSWPGTFSLFSLVAGYMGKSDVILLLRWFPLAIELAYLPAVMAIARASGVSRRVGWLGIALFYGTDWIYQDYFSPQAVNYLFFLVTVALVLTCWQPAAALVSRGHVALRARWAVTREAVRARRLLGYEAATSWPASTVMGAFLVLCLVFVAAAMSHQLTPYAIVLALLACLFTRRLGRPELAAIGFLLAVGWLSLGASNYWLGHLAQIFGGIFNFGSTTRSNLSGRVVGSFSHRLIVDARIMLTAGLFLLAALGAARRATASRTLELLAIAPFFLLAAQSYGGEGLLRVALLSGPFAALLAASAILPSREGPIRPVLRQIRFGRHGRALIGVVVAVVLLGSTTIMSAVRGGNDYYESFSTAELTAVNFIYHHAGSKQVIGLVAPYEPIGQWKVGDVVVRGVAAAGSIPTQKQIGLSFVQHCPDWVILGQAQLHWGEVLAGYKATWMTSLISYLHASGYRKMGNFGADATVLHILLPGTCHLPPKVVTRR
jgi:hypothetical protein